MSISKAFTKVIGTIGSSKAEEFNVHQVSPTWVLTFVRWDIRDTIRSIKQTGANVDLLRVRKPLVVENDCVQVSVVVNKSVLTHSVSIILVETDVNYSTAIAPGDFVFVNMLNSEVEARRIAETASSNSGNINEPNDGFKGFFKVQGVRKTVTVDPSSGIKRVLIRVNGFAFTEFNNIIYYNPYILAKDAGKNSAGEDTDSLSFITNNLGAAYAKLVSPNGNAPCQNLIRALIGAFIGTGVTDHGKTSDNEMILTANTNFYVPPQVSRLLGLPSAKAAKDIYTYLFGIQQYGSGSAKGDISIGFNPSNLAPQDGRFYITHDRCPGNTLLKAEYWNQVSAWSIINQYTNSPINELYSCFRISPEGKILPTIVFRQIPFTSELFGSNKFNSTATVTKFLNVPRWKVSNALVFSTDLGREETARINFVQYYSQPPSGMQKPDGWLSAQSAAKNYVHDINDVLRSGLRPYIVNGTFEDITLNSPEKNARQWALILGDAVMGGHLKMNGTIECAGIIDPIAVGDNLEYDRVVYHIEEVSHSCSIDFVSGNKMFRTILKLSHGVSVSDYNAGLAYPEMIHTRGYQDRSDNYSSINKSLPGVSEAQDVRYRKGGRVEPTLAEIKEKDRPFTQPGKTIKPIKGNSDDSK